MTPAEVFADAQRALKAFSRPKIWRNPPQVGYSDEARRFAGPKPEPSKKKLPQRSDSRVLEDALLPRFFFGAFNWPSRPQKTPRTK